MSNKLDGKFIAEKVKEEIKSKVAGYLDAGKRAPHCAVILVGENPASLTYVKNKEESFKRAGMESSIYRLEGDISQHQLEEIVEVLNKDDEIDGILIQLPLPDHINYKEVLELIDPVKDVDGLTNENKGLIQTDDGMVPCTPLGIMELFKRYDIDVTGKHCVVVGRSHLVGHPMSQLLLKNNATVTICHSKTENLKEITQLADILIVAIGKPLFIDDSYLKQDAILVDVGIHKMETGLVGDCSESAYEKASYYTPVPKGVGPMTVAMLLSNTLRVYQRRNYGA